MLRRLFTLASAGSLLLCTSTVLFWLRSGETDDLVGYQTDATYVFLASSDGYVVWGSAQCSGRRGFGFDSCQALLGMMMMEFLTEPDRSGRRIDWWWIWTPMYVVTAITSFLPICWAIAKAAQHRVRAYDCCPHCGYILTGNTSGTCPECGTPIPSFVATPELKGPHPA